MCTRTRTHTHTHAHTNGHERISIVEGIRRTEDCSKEAYTNHHPLFTQLLIRDRLRIGLWLCIMGLFQSTKYVTSCWSLVSHRMVCTDLKIKPNRSQPRSGITHWGRNKLRIRVKLATTTPAKSTSKYWVFLQKSTPETRSFDLFTLMNHPLRALQNSTRRILELSDDAAAGGADGQNNVMKHYQYI